ncbi:YiiX/YebB-like N1pC/P60 family cysteine hydrolase [Pseudolactococcus yaeyamensis]
MNKAKLALVSAVLLLSFGTSIAVSANDEVVTYTPEQQQIIDQMGEREKEYLDYGKTAPIEADAKNKSRARIGSWSWRDGVICVTDDGVQSTFLNSWHAGIVAPQKGYVVAEAEGLGKKVRLRGGEWSSSTHNVWQVGVNNTSVQQDWKAGEWAGHQVGKPYNLNFWNIKQKDSFYCSQLVWAAHPGEFVNNANTTVVYRNR